MAGRAPVALARVPRVEGACCRLPPQRSSLEQHALTPCRPHKDDTQAYLFASVDLRVHDLSAKLDTHPHLGRLVTEVDLADDPHKAAAFLAQLTCSPTSLPYTGSRVSCRVPPAFHRSLTGPGSPSSQSASALRSSSTRRTTPRPSTPGSTSLPSGSSRSKGGLPTSSSTSVSKASPSSSTTLSSFTCRRCARPYSTRSAASST